MGHIEIKAQISADELGVVKGIAWPFGTPDSVGDTIEPGAFKGLRLPLPMLFEHSPTPVGAWTEAEETAEGLRVTGRLFVPSLSRANEVHKAVRTGRVAGLSIGFKSIDASPRRGGRVFKSIDLSEISLCRRPVHRGAQITLSKSAAVAVIEAINAATAALKRK